MKNVSIFLFSLALPFVTFAQGTNITYSGSFIDRLLNFIKGFLTALPPIFVAVAGLVFMYSILKFLFENDATKKDEDKKWIIYSLIALVVLLGFWSIVTTISNALDITRGDKVTGTEVPGVTLN